MRAFGLRKVFGFYLVMAGAAVVAVWRNGELHTWLPAMTVAGWGLAVGAGVGAGLAMVAISRVATRSFGWAERLSEEFRSLLGPMTGREILVIATLSGIGEEALFRGTLQPMLGLWIASAVFGVLHIGPSARFLPWTVMAFGAGLGFGGLFVWTGSLVAPILAHFTVNYLNLRYLAPADDTELHIDPIGGEHVAGH